MKEVVVFFGANIFDFVRGVSRKAGCERILHTLGLPCAEKMEKLSRVDASLGFWGTPQHFYGKAEKAKWTPKMLHFFKTRPI